VLVVSDYSKGVVSPRLMRAVVAAAQCLGVPLVVDPKRRDFHLYAGATLLTPNVQELEFATGIDCAEAEDRERAARQVIDMTGAAVLLTRSEHGVCLYRHDAPTWSQGGRAEVVRDVSGAGDAVLAAAAVALAVGAEITEAAHLANVAAGVVVGKSGTASVTSDELNLALLRGNDAAAIEGKLMTASSALAARVSWRSAGLAVGLTNGVFDLIHPGHVRLLAEARRRCDRLIVALNTDASVRRLKGADRPIQSELARAEVIGALRSVDVVVLFEADTPFDLIAALRPDVLIKGADYTIETVVGGELVLGWGGRVELVDVVPGQSSTRLIARSRVQTP
jgi:D-beta-D-heptose 7-phosphate kinase/D-beta-D-heptose 1-phosphate adenosyltransferase